MKRTYCSRMVKNESIITKTVLDLFKLQELFYLLEDDDGEFRGSGEVPLHNMKLELEAGGLSSEHVQMVSGKPFGSAF